MEDDLCQEGNPGGPDGGTLSISLPKQPRRGVAGKGKLKSEWEVCGRQVQDALQVSVRCPAQQRGSWKRL